VAQEQSRFVILGDPMVDMDPTRRELGKEQQVLVMTCHQEYLGKVDHKR